ncbi:MAG: DHH family phosphoesterase [Firmicutes bacterium]|nr:DHH family phosphoesterase [Bacillota bacterium]
MYAGRIERLISRYSPIPMCAINMQGKVTRASGTIAEVFKYDGIIDGDIFALTGLKLAVIADAVREHRPLYIERNDRKFKLLGEFLGDGDTASLLLYFIDVTDFEELKQKYKQRKLAIALVSVDNYDELINIAEDWQLELINQIDKFIRGWATKIGAAITRYKDHLYSFTMDQDCYEQLKSENFQILDEARKIDAGADFPVTLSIGVGMGGETPAVSDRYAQDALDIALGRGGDQAVVKDVQDLEYYGGKTQGVEKSNKGKSRLIAHALRALMNQSSRIFIMGHKNPDMDCFGAALGISRIAQSIGKDTYILLGSYDETMADLIQDAKDTGDYEFVSDERAVSLYRDNSLVVVVDTHRPGLVESLDLVEMTQKLVVIDHHRRAEDLLPHQVLSYMEPYASSASELVAEVVQYACEKKSLSKVEADALLAGIMLDTNRFAVKAGVRTFEAASWLRRNGADLQTVRRYFQANAENFRVRAACVAEAKIIDDRIAMSIHEGRNNNAQIVNSQVADELLTIKGIEASFVAGQDQNGETVVSARSLGTINVQRIMEQFGGGGHLNTAGARVSQTPREILAEIEEFFKTSQ